MKKISLRTVVRSIFDKWDKPLPTAPVSKKAAAMPQSTAKRRPDPERGGWHFMVE